MAQEGIPVEREALYNEVWTEPVSVVAPRYGLSDVGLAKVCRSLAIPLPSRGYWAKVKAGKVMRRAALPPFQASAGVTTGLVKLPPDVAAARESARRTAAKIRKERPTLEPALNAAEFHPLVEVAAKRLRRKTGWPEGALVRSAPNEVLNLSVTVGALDRALSLTNIIIAALHTEGFEFEVDADKGVTWIRRLETGTRMRFSLSERVKRSVHQATASEERALQRYRNRSGWDSVPYPHIPRYDYTPTGFLVLEVYGWPSSTWKDTERTKLEQRLGEVVAGVVQLADAVYAREQEDLRREQARQLAIERFETWSERHSREVASIQSLETDVTNWERASRIRAFADAKELLIGSAGEISRADADWLDPLIPVSDVILDAPEPKRPSRW